MLIISAASNDTRAVELQEKFTRKREQYCGAPFEDELLVDVELISNVIEKLERGKTAGLDSLSAKHLLYGHQIVSNILTKLFNLMLRCSYLPVYFGLSYTVPLPKLINYRCKSVSCSDFRGIAISSIFSNLLEHRILDRYECYFSSNDNQFGCKKRRWVFTSRTHR